MTVDQLTAVQRSHSVCVFPSTLDFDDLSLVGAVRNGNTIKKKEKLKAFIIRTVRALPVSLWALSRFSGGPSSVIKRQLVQDATPSSTTGQLG